MINQQYSLKNKLLYRSIIILICFYDVIVTSLKFITLLMYNQRTNSKKKNTNTAVMYSAALQDHFLKKNNFNLLDIKSSISNKNIQTPSTNSHTNNFAKKLPAINKTDKYIAEMQKIEKKSILPYESQALKKLKQMKSDEDKMKKYNKRLTWAQKLGIVEAPPLPLTANDWIKIQQKSKKRNDHESICSICLEDFKIDPQVILSCSHVFHHKCLQSFQKHNKVHCCPICRKQNYDKKVIDQAIRLFTLKSIIRLQRVFRGSKDRIKIYSSLVDRGYKAESKLFNRRLIGFKMWKLSSKINDKIKKDKQMYEKMMNDLQSKHKKETNQIMQEMVRTQRQKILNEGKIGEYLEKFGLGKDMPENKQVYEYDWNEIIKKGEERAEDQCSICLAALWSKPVYLLSCTHSFHVNCIQSFQRYSLPGSQNKCPCCRSQYQKKVVQLKKK